jgi:hypothetical protein
MGIVIAIIQGVFTIIFMMMRFAFQLVMMLTKALMSLGRR